MKTKMTQKEFEKHITSLIPNYFSDYGEGFNEAIRRIKSELRNIEIIPEPEVDEELEAAKEKFPKGTKFRYDDSTYINTVESVHRDKARIILITTDGATWHYSSLERHFHIVDEELEAARKKFKKGDRVYWDSKINGKTIDTVVDVIRDDENNLRVMFKDGSLLLHHVHHVPPAPVFPAPVFPAPVFPECLKDGWWLWQYAKDTWYFSENEPNTMDIMGYPLARPTGSILYVDDYLASLGLTLDDLKIPDEPEPSKRKWCKGK